MAEVFYTEPFKRDFAKLPEDLKRLTEKQIRLLLENRAYPSLHLKKLKGHQNIWEARVSRRYRVFLTFENNLIVFHRVGPHDLNRHPF